MGALLGFITSFVSAFQKRGGTDELLHELLVGKQSEDFINQVADLAMKMVKTVRDGFWVVVDYSKSLTEMISAGNYDWVNSDISEKNFPVNGKGQIESNIELIHYGKSMSSEDVIQDMETKGLRPATLSELLAFGKSYPDKQREFPIVALGSVWRNLFGTRFVAFLSSFDSKRLLHLCIWGGGWVESCRFAAVRK